MIRFLTPIAAIVLMSSANAAGAVTVETSQFLTSPTYFNGFENIASSPSFTAPFVYASNADYSEGGLTVRYEGYPGSLILTQNFQHVGTNGWGVFNSTGYTKVTLSGGGRFSALQFLAGTSSGSTTYYEALLGGIVVSTGTIGPVVSSELRYYGLSGGGFDEVRLQTHFDTAFRPDRSDTGVFDSFAATGAVPEPATWALMIVGFGMVGATMRRRAVVVA